MHTLDFVWVDVFTTTRFEGNPLAIVRIPSEHAGSLTTEQLQTIAFEFNLSETVFIYLKDSGANTKDSIPEWRIRIFFPTAELPFAGHPTIGTACYALGTLASGNTRGRLLCNAGPIELDYHDGVATAGIPHNFHQHTEQPFTLEQVYDLQPALKQAGREPLAIDTVSPVKGMNFISIELSSLEALSLVQPPGKPANATLDSDWNTGLIGSYFYVVQSRSVGKASLRTRMLESAIEDPATGSAACGLCMFLALKWREASRTEFEIVQGVEMGRRSEIGVVVTLKEWLDSVEKVELRGSAVKVMEGRVEC